MYMTTSRERRLANLARKRARRTDSRAADGCHFRQDRLEEFPAMQTSYIGNIWGTQLLATV